MSVANLFKVSRYFRLPTRSR